MPTQRHAPSAAGSPGLVRSAGWILAAALLATTAAVLWTVQRWLATHTPAVGDGRTVESYRFPLDSCQVPRATLVASGMPKDGLRALLEPTMWRPEMLARQTERRYRKLLLGHDLVAGLVIGGETRAYPLRFLTWHEVVNDVVGGIPVVVAHHPVSATTVAFSRRIGGANLEFGVSGLLSNSTQLLYEGENPFELFG